MHSTDASDCFAMALAETILVVRALLEKAHVARILLVKVKDARALLEKMYVVRILLVKVIVVMPLLEQVKDVRALLVNLHAVRVLLVTVVVVMPPLERVKGVRVLLVKVMALIHYYLEEQNFLRSQMKCLGRHVRPNFEASNHRYDEREGHRWLVLIPRAQTVDQSSTTRAEDAGPPWKQQDRWPRQEICLATSAGDAHTGLNQRNRLNKKEKGGR